MRKFFSKLIDATISPNQFYVLYCIKNGKEALFVNINLEMRSLKLMGFIDKQGNILPKGLLLLEEMEKISLTKDKPSAKNIEPGLLDQYVQLWPAIKLPTGKYARTDKKNLEGAFKWFFANHPYSWDTVLTATEMYVEQYRLDNYKFMRTSQYFIRKNDLSELANYCSIVESGGTIDNTNTFKDKVV